jgi:16S rRNA (cytidine1402-2'-O)-methyltransferase
MAPTAYRPSMMVSGHSRLTMPTEQTPMSPAKEKSLDYPLLAREFLKASGEDAISKLPVALYIVATPIGHLGDITLRALITLANVDHIACEDTRTSGGMLEKYGIQKPLLSYHDHNAAAAGKKILDLLENGESVALISDAGMPLISDPGFQLVKNCHAQNRPVTVIPGANAALTALAGSGMPTDQFHFVGFLPPKTSSRQKSIAALVAIPGTLILYEAPQRLADCLADLAKILGNNRPVAIARELTKLYEETVPGTLGELAEKYTGKDIKGEIVILIAPATEHTQTTATDIEAMLKDALKTQTLRDAVNTVSIVTSTKKNEVYALALQLSGQKPSGKGKK